MLDEGKISSKYKTNLFLLKYIMMQTVHTPSKQRIMSPPITIIVITTATRRVANMLSSPDPSSLTSLGLDSGGI